MKVLTLHCVACDPIAEGGAQLPPGGGGCLGSPPFPPLVGGGGRCTFHLAGVKVPAPHVVFSVTTPEGGVGASVQPGKDESLGSLFSLCWLGWGLSSCVVFVWRRPDCLNVFCLGRAILQLESKFFSGIDLFI